MFKVKILTVGKCKEAWLADALAEYAKRLQGKLSIEWLLAKNDLQLAAWASAEPHLIALDPKGELLTSEAFSARLAETLAEGGSRLAFAIGGPEGLPRQLLEKARRKWSLSPLTFTHQIARLILAEQLYRALEIEKGSQYHK